jgi:hypothetical protein
MSKIDIVAMRICFLPIVYLIMGLANNTIFYKAGVHDCSNMAAEQCFILEQIGLEPVIITGIIDMREKEVCHAWYSVNDFEINPTNLMPMSISLMIDRATVKTKHVRSKADLTDTHIFKEGEFDIKFDYYLQMH